MPNTREKLIDLVCDAMEDECIGHCNYPPCFPVENIVNKLIANGVTVQVKKEKQPTDLTGKCGSCAYAAAVHNVFGGSHCYVKCTNKEHCRLYCRNHNISMIRQRTTRACKSYCPMPQPPKGE